MDICQMASVRQNHCEKSIELQLYDFQEFPSIDVDSFGIVVEKFISGDIMKSGTVRTKNAISFIMKCEDSRDFHDCISDFVMKFIKQQFSPGFSEKLACTGAFVRFRLPIEGGQDVQDFSVSSEVMKVLLDRGIHLDFWFLR